MKRCHHQLVLEIIGLFIILISESETLITGFSSPVNPFSKEERFFQIRRTFPCRP